MRRVPPNRQPLLATLAAISLVAATAVPALAQPSQTEINQAIDDGLAYLASIQNPGGNWSGTGYIGETALCVLAFEHDALVRGYAPLDPAYPYSANVLAGLEWMLAQGVIVAISAQPAGDPDSNGNGQGVWFPVGGEYMYNTGLVLAAVSSSAAPTRTVGAGALAGSTYLYVAQEIVDALAFGQNEAGGGVYRGGWRYQPNTTSSDNSISGFVTVGLAYAEAHPPYGFGLAVPAWVKTELGTYWLNFIQNTVAGPTYGGSGYSNPNEWVNIYKTGHYLLQTRFVGDTAATQRVIDALGYISNHWNDTSLDPGWGYYTGSDWLLSLLAMLSVTHGAVHHELALIGPNDWYTGFATALVADQAANGSWREDIGWLGSYPGSTAIGVLVLRRAAAVDLIAPPTATVTTPANDGIYTIPMMPAAFSGQAADNAMGVGLAADSTVVAIRRVFDGLYWDGSAWVAGPVWLPTTHAATTLGNATTWSAAIVSSTWPAGTYAVQAMATDLAGNQGTGPEILFRIDEGAIPALGAVGLLLLAMVLAGLAVLRLRG